MAKPNKPDQPGEPAGESIVPNRVVMVNPLSKGNLGKTTFYEYLVACLEESNISWSGANMDNRHLTFQQAHSTLVKNLFAENAQAVDEYQPVFLAVRRSTSSLYLIDQRAQADLAFLQSARDTGFLANCQDQRVRIVPICFALNDLDYIQNLDDTVVAFAEEGITRWIVVIHTGLHNGDVFLRSTLMKLLIRQGAVVINMPYLSKTSMSMYSGVNASEGGPFSFREALKQTAMVSASECKTELERSITKMALQFRANAELMLPEGVEFTPVSNVNDEGWGASGTGTPTDAAATKRRRESFASSFMGEDS